MKWSILLVICLMLFVASAVVAQNEPDIAAAFESISYEYDKDSKEVVITLKLSEKAVNTAPEGASLGIWVKTDYDAKQRRLNHMLEKDQLDYIFKIGIVDNYSMNKITPTLTIDWQEFSFQAEYKYAVDGADRQPKYIKGPVFIVRRNILEPGVRKAKVDLSPPTWFGEKSVKICAKTSNDVRVGISLIRLSDNNNSIIAHQVVLLDRTITGGTTVQLMVDPEFNITQNTNYEFRVFPVDDTTVISKPFPWTPGNPSDKYELSGDAPMNKDLHKLVFTNVDNLCQVRVGTSIPGKLSMVCKALNQGRFPEDDPSNFHTMHTFNFDLKGVEDGQYAFHFEGDSQSNLPFEDTNKVFVFTKNTSVTAVSPIRLALDDSNNLTVDYTLSRQVNNNVIIDGQPDKDGKVINCLLGTGVPVSNNGSNFRYKATCKLTDDFIRKTQLDGLTGPTGPNESIGVTMRIKEDGGEHSGRQIAAIEMNIIRVDPKKVSKLLDDAAKISDETQRKDKIKEALGISGNVQKGTDEQAAINYVANALRDRNNKKPFLTALNFARKVAVMYFGFPILASDK